MGFAKLKVAKQTNPIFGKSKVRIEDKPSFPSFKEAKEISQSL
jgi:hypothetical protein